MNTSRIIVRLDAEQRAAQIEMLTPNGVPAVQGLGNALRGIGIRPLHMVELSTPRYRVTRAKLVELDGSELTSGRVMQILCAARRQQELDSPTHCFRAA
jgi:hypothetical protein